MTSNTTSTTTSTTSQPATESSGSSNPLATAALVLGIAGLLPILPVIGSIAALVCGYASRSAGAQNQDRARAGILLGCVGIAAPLVALFVCCVVLGYPFPIERYQPGS